MDKALSETSSIYIYSLSVIWISSSGCFMFDYRESVLLRIQRRPRPGTRTLEAPHTEYEVAATKFWFLLHKMSSCYVESRRQWEYYNKFLYYIHKNVRFQKKRYPITWLKSSSWQFYPKGNKIEEKLLHFWKLFHIWKEEEILQKMYGNMFSDPESKIYLLELINDKNNQITNHDKVKSYKQAENSSTIRH